MNEKKIYFVGIGGIGMSALARYFMHEGYRVGGYDRTPSALTEQLEKEGASIHYEDSIELIGEEFRNPATTRVIYTPAVPADRLYSTRRIASRAPYASLWREVARPR